MYIKDGIAYAGEPVRLHTLCGVRPLDGCRLWLRFDGGEVRVFDMTPLLARPAFAPLADPALFNAVYLDYGVPTSADGQIDIDPEWLYADSVPLP